MYLLINRNIHNSKQGLYLYFNVMLLLIRVFSHHDVFADRLTILGDIVCHAPYLILQLKMGCDNYSKHKINKHKEPCSNYLLNTQLPYLF
jgi:hypothetical protein